MIADALAPPVVRTSTNVILTIQCKQLLVFLEKRLNDDDIHLLSLGMIHKISIQCGAIITGSIFS